MALPARQIRVLLTIDSTSPDRSLLVCNTGVPGSWDTRKVTCNSDHIFRVHSPPGAHVLGHPCASSVACGFSLSDSTKTPDQGPRAAVTNWHRPGG